MRICKQGMGASCEQTVALDRCEGATWQCTQAGTSNALEVVQTGNLTKLLLPCRPGGNGVIVPGMKDKSHHQQIPLMNFKGLKLSLK